MGFNKSFTKIYSIDYHFIRLKEYLPKFVCNSFIFQVAYKVFNFIPNFCSNMFGNDAQKQSFFLLLLILQSEGCLYTSTFVKEASSHVDIRDISNVEANNIDTEMEDDVGTKLSPILSPNKLWSICSLSTVLVIDKIVGGGWCTDSQHWHTHTNTDSDSFPNV